jgi:uncharacterized protein YkwD
LYFIWGSCSLDEVPQMTSSISSIHLSHTQWVAYRLLAATVALLFLVTPVSAEAASLSSGTLMSLVNAERTAAGLPALSSNATLTRAAQAKASDMAAKGYFAHTTPDGKSFSYFVTNAGYSYKSAGENLAQGFSTESGTVGAWMNSSGHRANIMAAKFTETGIATAEGTYNGKDVIFVVQLFGTPSASAAPAVAKAAPTAAKVTAAAPRTPVAARVLSASAKGEKEAVALQDKKKSAEPVSMTQAVAAALNTEKTSTIDELLRQLASLMAQLESLLAKARSVTA